MDPITIQMAPSARRIVEQVLAIQPGEHVLIIADAERPTSITQALAAAVGATAAETIVLTMKARSAGSVEPPPVVAAAMLAADAVILQTSYATYHTDARRAAAARGTRILDMWGFDEDMMLRGGITADYGEVQRTAERLASLLGAAQQAHLTTPAGTDLTMSIKGRKVFPFFANVRHPGACSALPDGEAALSPVEGTTEGVLVNPFAIEKHEIAFPKEPMRIEIRQGRIVSITGGSEADFLARLVEQAGEAARNIAEFALGANPACRLGGNMREAKKAWGTAHIGIGDNKALGGTVVGPLHIDLIVRYPTVTADDTVLVKDGKVVV